MTTPTIRPEAWKPCAHRGCCFRFRSDAARVWCAYHAEALSSEYRPYITSSPRKRPSKPKARDVEVAALLTETFGAHPGGDSTDG